MNTQNAQNIAALLHQSRSPSSWTLAQVHELVAAVRSATELETKLALLSFVSGLLAASRQIVTLQRDAAIAEQLAAERDSQIGGLH